MRLAATMHQTVAAFLAGVFVSALVFTHDASFGNEILLRGLLARDARSCQKTNVKVKATTSPAGGASGPSYLDAESSRSGRQPRVGNDDAAAVLVNDGVVHLGVVEAALETRSGLPSLEESDAGVNNGEVEAFGGKVKRFAEVLSAREAFAAAMASSRLAMALWTRAARPVTDSLTFYASAGYNEFVTHSWRFLTTTDPRILAAIAATFVALACVYIAVVAVARHLRRARYGARVRAAVTRVRERVDALWRRVTAPYVRAYRAVRHFGRSVTLRYNAFIAGGGFLHTEQIKSNQIKSHQQRRTHCAVLFLISMRRSSITGSTRHLFRRHPTRAVHPMMMMTTRA